MSVIKDFLLQLSLVFVPFGIYLAYVSGHIRKRKNMTLILSTLWGISIILCISFPVVYGTNINQDLRIVPLLIGTLYCGRRTGVSLVLLLILYRLYFGGLDVGFYTSLLAILIGFPVILFFQMTFANTSKRKKIKIALYLAGFYNLAGAFLVGFLRGVSIESIAVQAIHFSLTLSLSWMMISLVENMAEIHTMRQELHDAERFRLIGDLAGVFAHEIRNPMQVARGFLQLLDTPDLPPVKKQYIQLSIEELDRANAIIGEFLLLGKPISNRQEQVEVGVQLERTVSLIENYASSRNVSIETSIENHCIIVGNVQRLNQFMINIMKNAIEAMPDGGTVFAACGSVSASHIEIHIRDEGMGMSKQEVERLGSPYYSLKENGTGLGMMISFQIIRSFGGELRVFSEKNKGTRVVARIPRMKMEKSSG